MPNLNYKYNIPFLEGKKISNSTILSNSFGASCEKIKFEDNSYIVLKILKAKKGNYDSIYYEGKSLKFMYNTFPELFPKVLYLNNNTLVLEYINHNNIKNNNSEKDFAFKLTRIHQLKHSEFGFDFDTPIGGLRQPSNYQKSWIDFYGNNRLGMIFEEINKTDPMPKKINKGIEKILKNLKNLIPDNPKPSLIHGDLWKENILFNDGRLVGLIDPGIHYAHNEMEIAYLKWFKYINNNFYNYYSEIINIDKEFFNYSEIYELYYALLNVHLWSREYIQNAADLVSKYN